MFKNMSFRNMIILNVFLVFFVFSIVIFFVFNSFSLNNIKQKFIDENKYSQKVTEDYIYKEISTLVFFSKQISFDKILRIALKTGQNVIINDTSTDKPVQIDKATKFSYTTIANNVKNSVFGGSESLIRKDVELYNSNFDLLATTAIMNKNSADPKLLAAAFGSSIHKGDDIGVISFEENDFFLKSFSAIYSDSNYGVVVVKEKLDSIMLEDIKRTTSRELILIRNNKIFTSTLYKDSKRIENLDIKFDTHNLSSEKEIYINNKKMIFHLIPLFDSSKNIVGYLGTGFNFEPVVYLFIKSTATFLAFELLFSFLMFGVIYLFLTYLFQPFNDILRGIKNIGEGKYGNRINIESGKELKLVASGINALSETVEHREGELKELNNKLLEYSVELKSNNLKLNGLNEKLTEYSEELEIKNQKLLEIDKMKDNFLANTSHELKTPINGIIGLSESLTDGIAGTLPEKAMFNLNMIISSGKRLLNLVNDILDFSKIRNKELTIERKTLNIKYLTDLVMFVCRPLLLNRPITLLNNIPDTFPSVYGDENRLQQILYNLIGNAVKFTEKGEITVSAKINSNFSEISITDTGIGIPADKFDSIFESFEQVDNSASRTYGGTGLGLSITKKLVELHKGTISLSSELNKGSTFTFTIPLSTSDDNTLIPEMTVETTLNREFDLATLVKPDITSNETVAYFPTLEESEKHFSILIVDDEIVNLQVMIDHLTIKNIDTEVAINGTEALEKVRNKKYDLILLDIMMPKISGYEVAQEIRKKYSQIELPILMLTAKNRTQDIEMGFKSGANDYLTKPFEKKELLARISTLLGLKRAVDISNQNIHNFEREQQLRYASEKVREINTLLTSSLETEKIISNLFSKIPELLDFDTLLFYKTKNEIFTLEKWQTDNALDISPLAVFSSLSNKILTSTINTKKPNKFVSKSNMSPFTNLDISKGICLTIPIVFRDEITAVLVIENYQTDSTSTAILEMAHTIAAQTGTALENSALYSNIDVVNTELKSTLGKLKSLENLTTLIYTEEDKSITINNILYTILTGLGYCYKKGLYIDLSPETPKVTHYLESDGTVKSIDPNSIIESFDFINKDIERMSSKSVNFNQFILDKISKDFKDLSHTYIDKNTTNEDYLAILNEFSFSNIICLPIEYNETIFGMMVFERCNEPFTSQESDILRVFSENLSIYLEKKRLEKEQLDGQPALNYLCTSCNKKLLVYKGKADFVEIKCPRCNTFNTITKK